jgi:hypothetical protein
MSVKKPYVATVRRKFMAVLAGQLGSWTIATFQQLSVQPGVYSNGSGKRPVTSESHRANAKESDSIENHVSDVENAV